MSTHDQKQREKALQKAEDKTLKAAKEATNALGKPNQYEMETKLARAFAEYKNAENAAGKATTRQSQDKRDLVNLTYAEYANAKQLTAAPQSPKLQERKEVFAAYKNDLKNTIDNPQAQPNASIRNRGNAVAHEMAGEERHRQAQRQRDIQQSHLSEARAAQERRAAAQREMLQAARETNAHNQAVRQQRADLRQRQETLPERNAQALAQNREQLRQMAGEMRQNRAERQQGMMQEAREVERRNAQTRENRAFFKNNRTSLPTDQAILERTTRHQQQNPTDAEVLRQGMAQLPQGQPQQRQVQQPQQVQPQRQVPQQQPQVQQPQQVQPQRQVPQQQQPQQTQAQSTPPEQSASPKELINKWGKLVDNCIQSKIKYDNASPDKKGECKTNFETAKQALVSELKDVAKTTMLPGLAKVAKSFQSLVQGKENRAETPSVGGQESNVGKILREGLEKLMNHFSKSIGGALEKHASFLPGLNRNMSNQGSLRQMAGRDQTPNNPATPTNDQPNKRRPG